MNVIVRPRMQVVVRSEPWSGQVLEARPGSCLEVRFRRRPGAGPWRVEGCPPHLIPLAETDTGVLLLVFSDAGRGTTPLRLVRERAGANRRIEERQVAVRVDC